MSTFPSPAKERMVNRLFLLLVKLVILISYHIVELVQESLSVSSQMGLSEILQSLAFSFLYKDYLITNQVSFIFDHSSYDFYRLFKGKLQLFKAFVILKRDLPHKVPY